MQADTKNYCWTGKARSPKSLVEGFRQLFECSSEVLLEFADAAENNRLQRLFFDAQREFYLQEETIIGEFDHSLRESLKTFTDTPGGSAAGAETLSPGGGGRLRALTGARDHRQTSAQPADERAACLARSGFPRCSAVARFWPSRFRRIHADHPRIRPASRKLDVEKEVRLVFYTLFDRYVMSRLGDSYADLNRRLVELEYSQHQVRLSAIWRGETGNARSSASHGGNRWRGVG